MKIESNFFGQKFAEVKGKLNTFSVIGGHIMLCDMITSCFFITIVIIITITNH